MSAISSGGTAASVACPTCHGRGMQDYADGTTDDCRTCKNRRWPVRPCRFCGASESECRAVWTMRDDSDMGCCESCDHTQPCPRCGTTWTADIDTCPTCQDKQQGEADAEADRLKYQCQTVEGPHSGTEGDR